jgi:hypothetical protein
MLQRRAGAHEPPELRVVFELIHKNMTTSSSSFTLSAGNVNAKETESKEN